MIAALKEPKLFANIIMIGSTACYLNKEEGYKGGFEQEEVDALLSSMEQTGNTWAKPLGNKVIGKLGKPEHADELTLSFSDMAPGVARQFAEVTFFADFRQRVSSLKVPTLIIQSTNDPVVPLSAAQYLHKSINGSMLKIIEATGHYPLLSAPDEIIDNIKDYLEADLDLT
jgi:sigma-B regulation protein RsbQ